MFRYLLIFLLSISFLAQSEEELIKIDVNNVISKNNIVLRSSVAVDTKINSLIQNIFPLRNYLNFAEYIKIIEPVEDLLFTRPESYETATNVVLFFQNELKISSYYNDPLVWPFRKSREEVLNYLFTFYDFKICKYGFSCKKVNEVPYLRSMLSMILALPVFYSGDFEKALKMLDGIEDDLLEKPDSFYLDQYSYDHWDQYKSIFILSILIQRSEIAERTKGINSLIEKYKQIKPMLEPALDFIYQSRNQIPDWQFTFTSLLGTVMKLEYMLGNIKEVVRLGDLIKNKIPVKTENQAVNLNLREIHRYMVKAYTGFGNQETTSEEWSEIFEKQNEHLNLVYEYLIATNTFDWEINSLLILNFIENDYLDNYKEELSWMQLECKRNIGNKKAHEECLILTEVFTDGYERLLKAKNKEEKSAIADSIFHQITKYIALDLKDGTMEVADNIKDDSYGRKITDLDLLSATHFGYKTNNDLFLAGYFGKLFINKIQDIRRSLDADFVTNFTTRYLLTLQNISDTFFDLGDYKSAWICLQIIKENNFLDYIRRRSDAIEFLTTLEIPVKENDLANKLILNEEKISEVNNKLLKNDLIESDKRLLKSSLEKFKREKDELKNEIKNYIAGFNKNDSIQSVASYVNLSDHEGAIQYQIRENSLLVYLSTKNSFKKFEVPVSKKELKKTILNVHNDLSINHQLNLKELSFLKDSLTKQIDDELVNAKITSLKIQTIDWLNYIPFELVFDNTSFDNIYRIATISNPKKYKLIDELYLYGASFGNTNRKYKPLPNVKYEIESIQKISDSSKYKLKNSIFLNEDFNRESFINSVKNNPRFMHIASHFRFNDVDIDNSELLLGDGSVIMLNDIEKDFESISSELVVLSACDTGSIELDNSVNSADSLGSVFHLKGSKNVISTLWKVSDEATYEFMNIYYYILLNYEKNPAKALHLTKQIFKSKNLEDIPNYKNIFDKDMVIFYKRIEKFKQPFYWAAFQITSSNLN